MNLLIVLPVAGTALALFFRKILALRIVVILLLLYLGMLHFIDVRQTSRMLSLLPSNDEKNSQDIALIKSVIDRTNRQGEIVFLCLFLLALVPKENREQPPG